MHWHLEFREPMNLLGHGPERQQVPKFVFREMLEFLWGGNMLNLIEYLLGKMKKVHYLGDAGTRKPLATSDLRHGEGFVAIQHLLPFQRDLDNMLLRFLRSRVEVGSTGNRREIVWRISNRRDDKGLRPAAHEGHAHDGCNLEPSSDSCTVCGAIRLGTLARASLMASQSKRRTACRGNARFAPLSLTATPS